MLRQKFSTPKQNKIEKRLKLEEFYITDQVAHIPNMNVAEYYKKIVKKKNYAKQHHQL